jgi:hypothetical protein
MTEETKKGRIDMPRKNRRILPAACAALAAAAAATAQTRYPHCQIVDRLAEPLALAEMGYVTREDLGSGEGDLGFVEERAGAHLGFALAGPMELDLAAALNLWIAVGDEQIETPGTLGQVFVRGRMDVRTARGFTLRLEGQPGFYGEIDAWGSGAFFIPFGLSGIHAVNDALSLQIGMTVYPDFDRLVDPVVGMRAALGSRAWLDLFYPESRLVWQAASSFSLLAGLAFNKALEFDLGDDPRDRFRLEDTRAYVGGDVRMTESLQLALRAGIAFDRRIEWDGLEPDGREPDSGFFASAGLAGAW